MLDIGLEPQRAMVLWVNLAVLLIAARGLGALAKRFGQPTIVGALLAGVLLGPSVFGQVWPAGFAWFLPSGSIQGNLLGTVAQVSLLMLLIVLGAETDLPLIRSLGKASVWVTIGSATVPFAAGLGAGYLLPPELAGDSGTLPFALLVGGALGVSSLPVVATIVQELGMVRRNFGQLAVASATVHDALGFLVLALAGVFASETTGLGGFLLPLLGLLVLVAVLAAAGQPAVDFLLWRVRRAGPNVSGSLTISIGFALVLAAASQALHLEAALGAFLAGVVLGRSRFQQGQALRYLEAFSGAVFAPLYFATAGLRADLTTMASPAMVVSAAALLVVAATAKYAGARLGASIAGLPAPEGRALGVVLNGRGALQVILATTGLSMGIFGPAAYSTVIVLSILTSMAVPPLLRKTVRDWNGSEQERQRLEREAQLENNVVVRGQPLLLPNHGSHNSASAAQLLDCAWPDSSDVTILSIADDLDRKPGQKPDTGPVRKAFRGRTVRQRRATSQHALDEILRQVNLGYGVIGLGAVESPSRGRLLPPVVEGLLNRSPIPLVIVRHGEQEPEVDSAGHASYRHIAVPVTGTAASRAGQEVANNISLRSGGDVTLVHALTRPHAPGLDGQPEGPAEDQTWLHARDGWPGTHAGSAAVGAATAILDAAHETATAQHVRPHLSLRHGSSAGTEIENALDETRPDLVVLGATVRRVAGRPFLGHTVEHLLEHATEPTIVVVVLPDAAAVNAAASGARSDRSAH